MLCGGCASGSGGATDAAVPAGPGTSVPASGTPSASVYAAFESALKPLVLDSEVPKGADILAALESGAGLAADSLAVTADRTPTNLPVDTVTVAYRYDAKTCFIGQFLPKRFLSTVAEPVNGSCLIGQEEE